MSRQAATDAPDALDSCAGGMALAALGTLCMALLGSLATLLVGSASSVSIAGH